MRRGSPQGSPGMPLDAGIFVAGHEGLLGRALVRALRDRGHDGLVLSPRRALDLRRAEAVEGFFREHRPEFVFLAAGRVGGISANRESPADFIRENLAIETNVIEAARRSGARGLVFFGSSCMYPRDADQPMREEQLWGGRLESTSQAYAVAKLAGLEMCRAYSTQYGVAFRTLIPATLYGPFDHFHSSRAHVIPDLIERIGDAMEAGADHVAVLGTGRSLREFLYVDDAARAAIHLMGTGDAEDVYNAGSGEEIQILDLAGRIGRILGFKGRIQPDDSGPDGAPRKLLDSSRLRALGWASSLDLERGLEETVAWYREHRATSGRRPADSG